LQTLLTELIGVCKGVIADGKVVPEEAEYLRDWLARNAQVAHLWPADVLSRRLADVFADGKVDEQEQADLLELLTKITADQPRISQAQALAVPLPLDVPEPAVEFGKRRFCLAGKFLYGPPAKCRQAVTQRGGSVQVRPSAHTDYVVIGALNSADWNACADADKIRSALRFKQHGQPLYIISEEHWNASLEQI
ncbi:MAG TPA: hypothetical protein VL359_02525, partial [bacterium]|nr:hypothetical protein [bacterium]